MIVGIEKLVAFGILMAACVGDVAGEGALRFQAQVPFHFVVGNQTLPPGTYIVQRLTGKILDSTGVVVIKTSNDRIYRAVITHRKPERRAGTVSAIRFSTIQGRHYLGQICVAGDRWCDQLGTPADRALPNTWPIREVNLVNLR